MASISKNFFYNTALSLSQLVIPIFTFPYVARILGPGELGKVNFADSFAGYFMLFAGLGIPIYGIREIARAEKGKINHIFSEIFSIHLLFTSLVSIIYFLIVVFVFKGDHVLYFLLWGLLMLFSSSFIGEWYFQGTGRFKFIAIRTILNRIFFLIVLFLIIKTKSDSVLYFMMIVLSTFLNAIVNFYIISKNVKIKVNFSFMTISRHIKPIFYIFFSRAAITLFLFLDTIILGFLSSDSQVGFFTTALKITKIPIMIVSSLGVVLMPNLADAHSKNNIKIFRELIKKSISFVLGVSIPIVFFFYSCSDYIVEIFAGKQYSQASVLIKILCPIIIIIGLSTIFSQQILIPMKKDKEIMISVLIAITACIIFDFVLITYFNALGAAYTNVIVESIVMLSCFFFATKYLPRFFQIKEVMIYLITAIPALFFNNLVTILTDNVLMILALNITCSAIYFSIVYGIILKNEIFTALQNKIKHFFV